MYANSTANYQHGKLSAGKQHGKLSARQTISGGHVWGILNGWGCFFIHGKGSARQRISTAHYQHGKQHGGRFFILRNGKQHGHGHGSAAGTSGAGAVCSRAQLGHGLGHYAQPSTRQGAGEAWQRGGWSRSSLSAPLLTFRNHEFELPKFGNYKQ